MPLEAMLSAMMLVDDIDYSRRLYGVAEDGGLRDGRPAAERFGVRRIAPSGCESAPYLLVDERELFGAPPSSSAVDAALACAARRGVIVSLSVAPPATVPRARTPTHSAACVIALSTVWLRPTGAARLAQRRAAAAAAAPQPVAGRDWLRTPPACLQM
eukprot:2749381-Prymnesium_polylepis.1